MAATERDALFQALDALEALQIPYVVVGSFASTFWGRPRLTHDADLVVELPLNSLLQKYQLKHSFFQGVSPGMQSDRPRSGTDLTKPMRTRYYIWRYHKLVFQESIA